MSRKTIHAVIVEDPRSTRCLEYITAVVADAVTVVTDVGEIPACLERSRAQLVVVDVDLDADDRLSRLLETGTLRAMACVAVGSAADPAKAFRLAQLGVRALVSKPIGEDRLVAELRSAIEHRPDIRPQLRALVGKVPIHEIERTARRTMLEEALARAGGCKTEAARLLNVSRQLLQHMARGQKRAC